MDTEDVTKKELLKSSETIAIVGLSANKKKPSHTVAKYLINAGYRIIPVNPGYKEILGNKCYHSISDITEKVDIVDIFMRADNIVPVVKEAIGIKPACVWLQLGIVNEEAKKLTESLGIIFFMDVCIKKEHERLFKNSDRGSE